MLPQPKAEVLKRLLSNNSDKQIQHLYQMETVMAKVVEAITTKSEAERGAYAVIKETDETVYIPVKVAEAAELDVFDEVKLIVIRNDRPEPPWRAVTAMRLTEI